MKNLGVIIFLVLIGGGVYLYLKKPETFKELTSTVTDKIKEVAGDNNFKKLRDYESEFKEKGITKDKEQEGFLAGFKEKVIYNEFKDSDSGRITLANDGTDVSIIIVSYSAKTTAKTPEVAREMWKHFFGEDVVFTAKGASEGKHASGTWSVENNMVLVTIYQKDLAVLPAITSLDKDIQEAIAAFRLLVQEKVSLEAKFQQLDEERHFCFDAERFKAIENEMNDLKKSAATLTEKAQALTAKIPEPYIAQIRYELDRSSTP